MCPCPAHYRGPSPSSGSRGPWPNPFKKGPYFSIDSAVLQSDREDSFSHFLPRTFTYKFIPPPLFFIYAQKFPHLSKFSLSFMIMTFISYIPILPLCKK
jgi:hypothetical protein